jgi:hypothetical protein
MSEVPGSHNPEILASEDRPKSVLTRLISFSPHEQGFIPGLNLVRQRSMIKMLWPIDYQQKKYQYQNEEKK